MQKMYKVCAAILLRNLNAKIYAEIYEFCAGIFRDKNYMKKYAFFFRNEYEKILLFSQKFIRKFRKHLYEENNVCSEI